MAKSLQRHWKTVVTLNFLIFKCAITQPQDENIFYWCVKKKKREKRIPVLGVLILLSWKNWDLFYKFERWNLKVCRHEKPSSRYIFQSFKEGINNIRPCKHIHIYFVELEWETYLSARCYLNKSSVRSYRFDFTVPDLKDITESCILLQLLLQLSRSLLGHLKCIWILKTLMSIYSSWKSVLFI